MVGVETYKRATNRGDNLNWGDLKQNYYAALEMQREGDYVPQYKSDDGDSSNEKHKTQRRKRYIEQSKYLKGSNKARK